MPPNSPLRDPASRDYLKRQQQQSDALAQQAQQNAENDARQANDAQRQQEQQARETQRQQQAQQKEALRAQNVATEADLQARNQPQYTSSDGVIRPQQDRETFDREQATKNQAKADALKYQQEGRKFAKNPIDGSTIPLQSDAAVEAARQAKAEAARRSVIDRKLQALRTEADDPALASAALTEAARVRAEKALTKKRDEARYALQAKLSQQAAAKTGTADWVPFNESPTPEAQAAAERLKRLENPNADLEDDDLALLDADPTTASTAAAVRNLKTRLAQADEAGQKITSAKTRIWEEEMRRDNPAKYRELQRQKLLSDPNAIEGAAQDFEARKAALETNAAEIATQRDQTRQQIADIEALNTQRMAEGVPAADLIQMSGPDGQPQPWSKELAAQRATLEAQAQAWDVEQEPRLLELQAEEEDLKATAALINEAQQGRQKQAETQRQQTLTNLAQQPGGKALVANLTALDAERAQRVADLQKLPEGSPERQAAEATLQGDLAAKAQQVQEAHGAERQAAAKFYAYLKEFDPQTDWTKPDRSLDQVLRNASAKSGIDPETAKQYLPSIAERDWSAGDTKAPSRVTSDGQLLINPTLASDPEAYKKAVESAKATPEAKQAALAQLPAAEKELAAAALPILAVQEDNPLFARNASAFIQALENPTAAARLLQGSLTGMADSLPSFNQFVEIISEKQPDFAGKSPADQAAAYLRMTKGRGVLSKYQDQILSGLINGTAAIPQQIAGAVAALTGNESAANVAATLSQNAQIDQQRLALTGANNAPGAQLAGSLASTVPSLAVAFAGGMVGQTFGRVGVALRAASKGDDIVAALSKGSAALYQQAAGVAGSSVAGGLQSLGGFYADAYQTFRERGQDHLTAHQNAAAPAMLAGMGTALLTLAGGATGVEKVFAAKGGADAVKAAVRTRWQAIMGGIVKEAGSEGLEEGFDQLWQGFLDQAAVNPSKTVKEIFAEALEAGAIGGILGGAIGGIQAATEAAPVTPAAAPNPANLPETVAAAEEAIDALDLPDLDPQTVARTQEAARSVLYIAQGSPLTDLPADSLAALDIVEDPKKPGQFINGTIVAGKDGGTKLVTYTGGQVSDPATGALRPVRVRMENGQPIISQTTLDKLETILPAVRAAIPLNETDRKNQVRTPAPTVQPPADAQETGIQSPSGSGNTQAPSNQNAGPAAPIVEESSVVDPAATERTNQLSLHLAELGLPPAQAETVAQAMVAKRGVVGTEYVEQVTSKEFIADLKALGISGSLSSVKAKENPLKAGPDLAQRLATYSPSAQSAPVETPAAIPPVTTAPTSDSSITAQGAAATAQGVVDIPQGEAKATPADASPVPVSGIDADAYLTARQAAMKAVPVGKRKDAVKLLGALDKAINRYGSAFAGVRFVTTPGGGLAVNRSGGKAFLDVDLAQWISQHTNLVDKAGVVALTELEEEFIHRAASAVFTDADMSGFFRGLPADLQRMVYKGYHVADIASKAMPAEPPAEFEDSKAVQLGHEFLRMLVQDSTFNGRVSEAIAADPGLGEKIIAFLQKLVSNLRKLIDKADTDTRVTIAEYEKRVTNEVNRLKKLLPDPLKAKETPTNLADTQDNRASVSSSPSPQVSSSPSLAPILGATYTAYTDSNDAIEVQWAVVDVNSLVLSNEDDGRINPAYPQELQPRDRTSAGSEAQVADIAKNFNLDRLSASNGVGDGAPIIGPDGIVESGNGRGMGARRAYATGKPSASSYRNTLMRRATEFGLNAEQVEAVQNPVLVRIRRTDVNRPAFVLAANVSTIAPKRDIEQAKIDAGQIVPDLFESYVPSEDGDIFTAANADFIKGYISAVIPPAERPAVIDARGNLSQAGLRRIRNALFVHAYGKSPEALNALARLTESVDAADTNIARALIAMAPRFGEQNARIAAGALQPLSITEELTAALQILSDLKNRGEKVTDWLAQDRIPGIGEDPGPVGNALVEYLHENRQRPRQIIDALTRYASAVDAAGDPRQMSMFGDEKPTKATLWARAAETAQPALAKSAVAPAPESPEESAALDAMFAAAAAAKPQLDEITREIAAKFGATPVIPPKLKGRARSLDKMRADYNGDATKLKDLARSTIEARSLPQAKAIAAEVSRRFGIAPKRNLFEENPVDGYRDALFNLVIDGHTVEMQIHVPEILETKEYLHQAYVVRTGVERKAKEAGRQPTDAEWLKIDRMNRIMRTAYNKALGIDPDLGASPEEIARRNGQAGSAGTSSSASSGLTRNPPLALTSSSEMGRGGSSSNAQPLPDVSRTTANASARNLSSGTSRNPDALGNSDGFFTGEDTRISPENQAIAITTANIADYAGNVDVSALRGRQKDWKDAFDWSPGVPVVPLSKLVSPKNELADRKFLGGLKKDPRQTAADWLVKAMNGTDGAQKRAPLDVTENPDGTYTIQDGNATAQALMLADWKAVPVNVVQPAALAKSRVTPDTGPDLFSFNTGMGLDALLTPAQKEAKVEQAGRSLGQLFLFDDATPRTFKPAEDLTLEADATNPAPATEQLRLFSSSKSPVSFITPLVNPQNETILSRNENDTADSHRNPSVALRLVQGSVSRGQEQAVNGERTPDRSQNRGGSGSTALVESPPKGLRALPELDAEALRIGLESIPEADQKQGQEHRVFLHTASDRAIKLTAPGEMGARQSLPGYLTQMQAMADLFQDGLAIEGWVQVPGESSPRLITTQPWVHGRESTLEEIETLMRRKGFLRMYDGAWWHSGQEMQVTDALPKNFITSATGHVHPIDLIFAWPPVRAHERIENIVNSQSQPPPLPEPTDETPTGSNTGLRLDALLTPGQQEAKNNVPSLNASTKAVRQEQLKGATTTVQGQTVQTGTPVTFRFLHNQDSATKRMGKPKRDSDFDRGFEPSGRFVTETTDPWLAEQNPDQYVTGTLTFENPIVIDSGEYGTDSSWKRRLSSLYSGKRGKNLSKAILADGFDGIITSGKYGPSEIVDLTTFDESKALYKSTVSPQQDADYLAAVNAGDMETAQRMVDAAAKAEGYDRRRFHQTARANVEAIYREGFDLSKGLARLSDNEVPDGVFLKPDTNDIGLGAVGDSVQMPVFAKMANPLFVNSRADLLQWASANPEYKSILLDLKELDADRSDDFKKLRENKRLWARTQTPEYEAAKKATDQFLSDWAQDVNRLSGKARAVLTQDLKKEGFDGVILFKDAGSFGRETRTEVVLDTRAVKSADPVTYDSAGKVIPLSERFNPKENSILYKSTVSPAEARFQESYGSNANLLYPFTLGGDTQEIPVTVWNNIPVPDDSAITAAETTRIGRALYRLSVIQRPDGQSYAQAEKFRVSDGFPEDLGGTFDKLEDSDIENNVTLNDRTRKLWESTRAQEGQLSLFKSSVQPTRPQPRLSALHNLSIENLVFADRMGGLAVPSIAVTPEGQGMSGFGGITLIGTRDLVDPRQEPVFDSDAYSPRFPDPEYPKAKSSAAMKVDELFRPFADRFEDRRIIDTVFDNAVNRPRPQETLRHMETSMPARAAFLASQGVDIQPVMRPMGMEASFVTQPAFAKYRENPALISQVDANDTAAMLQIGQDIRAAIDEETTIESETSERRAFLNDSYLSRYIDPETSMPHFGRLMRVEKGLAAIGKQQVDRGETSNRLAEAMEGKEPEFKAWAENLILPLHGAPSLTVKGRKQPYTLENIVTVMTGRVRGREDTMAFGEGVARAAVSKRFKDMDQMRTAATDQIMPQAEIEASRAEAQKLLEQYREAVSNYTSLTNYLGAPDYFAAMDASMRALVTWAKGKKDIATLASALRREGFKDVPQDVLEQGQTAAQAWLKSPVPYFEAKPQRAVRLSEFAGAVIPESSPVGVKNILDKHNIAYRTYDTEANQATTAAAWAQELAQQGQATLFKSSVALTPSGTLPDIPGWQAYQDSLSAARQGATDPTAAKAQTQAITEAYFRDNPNAQATIDARKALSQTVGRPIPPAWTQVQTYPPGSRLLVKGRDSKNRWQSIYSSEETQASLASKFARAKRVNALMPRILDGVKAGLTEGTEEASVLRLIYLSGFRNGGEGDTGAKVKAYGATTLLAEHVSIEGDTVSFDFTGKLGVRQQHEITDAALAADLSARKAKGGRLFATSPEKVLAALRTAAGTQDIKVHDLRTWNASSLALELVKANPAPETETDYWLKRDAVGDVVARKLGDTRKIVLESYIDPIVFAKWQESLTLNDDSERPKISRKQAAARGASGQLQRPNEEYERSLRDELLPSPGEGGWPVRDRGLSQSSLFKSSVAPTSYDTAPPDPITGIPSLITGPTTSRDQGRAIAQKHAQRLRAGLRGGEEKRDAGPALAKDRSRAFVVPILSTAQMDRLQSLPPIGEGAEAKVYADRANGTVYKVLQGYEESPALGIWPDLFSTVDGKLDYVFSPANRPRQLAARLAVQSLLGGTPTEIVGIGPDGHVILKQPLSSMPDIASRDAYIDAGVRTLAKQQAGLVLIPPGMLSDPKAPSTYLAVVDGRPYLVADLVPDNFVGDTQRNARLNDVVVTNLPAQIIPRVKGLAAVVTQAGQEAARLGDRANRLFASAKAVTSPMESNEAADQIVTNERLDEWLDTYMMNGWEDAENAIPGGGEEIAKLIAQTRPRNHDRDIHRGVNPNFGEITGRPLYSFSFQKETAQLAGGAGAKVTTKKGPTRYLSAEDIALARIRRDNKPHYAGQQAELFVPASELTTLAKSAVSPSPQVSEPLLSRLGNKILDAADFSMGVTSKVTQAVGLESPLQKLGWNHLDRMASAKIAALTRWTTDKTNVGEFVAKWGAHPNAQPFIGLGKGLKREFFPDSVLPREVAARKREMEIKTALGAQRGMDLVRALSGKPKFSDLAYPAEFSQNPMHRRNLYLAMTGEIPMTSLPQALQDLGGRLRDMLVDMGREAVKQGRMSTDTFANLQSGYMPHYYKEDVQREKSIIQRFRLGVRDILAQRTTAWHIVDNDTKDKTGEPRLISWQGNQWRFRNKEHRDAFYEDFILNETLSQVQARGGKAARALTLSDLRAPAKLDAELRGRIKEISLQLKMRYSKERPLDIDEQEKAGLIMDPVYSIARYTAQMVHDNSTAEFFNFVAGNKDWTSDTASPGFTEIPDNPRFGRLAGKYVTEDVSRQILEMVEAPNIALQLYDTLLGWWKTGKTVLNPGTHMRNVLGNVFFSQLAGTSVWNPGNVPYYKAALKAMRNGGPDLQEAYEMGVLGADFVSSELRQTLRQLLPDPATIADDGKPDVLLGIGKAIGRVVPDLLKNPLSKGYNQIAALYQAEDELFKLATYLKAKAMTGTPEAARDHVRTWFPYFDQGTSATLKTLGRTAMPFLGFYRESIRIFGNAVKERPIALATGLAVPSLITFLSAMLLGLDDDDVDQVKKDMRGKAGKLLGPTPFEGMPLFSMLLPVRSDTGQVQQFDISAIHPFVDFLGNRVEATTGQDWYQQMWRSMLAAGPVGSLVYSQMTGKDTFGDRTFVEENMTAMEKIGARADNLAKTILPPLAPGGTGFKTLMSAGERTTNKTFEVRSPVQAVTRAVIGLDVRNATPDLYRMADDWRKANGLPTSEGMDFGGTTPVSRARKALFAQLAQDEPNPQAIGNIKKALTTMGSPIKTPQDVQRLLFYRNPLMIIGGDKTKGLTASDAQQRFRNSLQGLEREALDQAMAEYEKIKAKAPSLLLR